MAKIVLSDELKKKIAETTGLTYLASNIEKFDDSEGKYVNELLNFYAPQRKMLEDVNVDIKAEIMKEVPELALEIQVPGEGGMVDPEPAPKPEKVTLTITTDPADAIVTINGEVTSGAECELGSTATYKVEKEGYKTVEDEVLMDESKVIEVVLEAEEEPVKQDPTITSEAPAEINVNEMVEYNVSTTPGDYEGEMVYVEVEAGIEPEKITTIEYFEVKDSTWKELPKNEDGKYYFGVPSVGFPLQAASSKFRIEINTAGEYTSIMKVIKVVDSSVMCQASSTVKVNDVPVAEESTSGVEESVEVTEVSTESAAKPAARSARKK